MLSNFYKEINEEVNHLKYFILKKSKCQAWSVTKLFKIVSYFFYKLKIWFKYIYKKKKYFTCVLSSAVIINAKLFACWVIFLAFVCWIFSELTSFRNPIIVSNCLILIRANTMLVLIWVQTVCKLVISW